MRPDASKEEVRAIEAIPENLERIKELFQDKFYIRYSPTRTASLLGEFVIMDSKDGKGFIVKEGCTIAFKESTKEIFLLPRKNGGENDIINVIKV